MKNNIADIISWHKGIGYGAFLLIALTADSGRSQSTLISVSGPPDTTHQYEGGLAVGGDLLGVSWTTTSAFSNVNISIALDGNSGATGTAYLTTKIGPGTTIANQIASTSFAFPSISTLAPVFTGLNLGAGTYYLLVRQTANGVNGNGVWEGTPSPNLTLAPNVTANGEYWSYNSVQSFAPASSFSEGFTTYFEYRVTGLPVPEPSTACLILFGGGVAVWRRSRNLIGF